jgi:hypothetical protein
VQKMLNGQSTAEEENVNEATASLRFELVQRPKEMGYNPYDNNSTITRRITDDHLADDPRTAEAWRQARAADRQKR